MLRAIGFEVRRLAWRNRWLDADDLKQEALLTALDVDTKGRWRSQPEPVAYMAKAVRSRLLEMVMRSGCPVKVGVGSNSGGWADMYAKAESCRAIAADESSAVPTPTPEEDLDRARALGEIRKVLAAAPPAARAVILGEEKPAEVAKSLGMRPEQVYWQTKSAHEAVKARLIELANS